MKFEFIFYKKKQMSLHELLMGYLGIFYVIFVIIMGTIVVFHYITNEDFRSSFGICGLFDLFALAPLYIILILVEIIGDSCIHD